MEPHKISNFPQKHIRRNVPPINNSLGYGCNASGLRIRRAWSFTRKASCRRRRRRQRQRQRNKFSTFFSIHVPERD